MWIQNDWGKKVFAGGQEDWKTAAEAAACCDSFSPDVDEELVAEDEQSCYNCRYRRWTAESFACMSPRS